MPSVTLHLVLADRILERWLDVPQEAPFDPTNPTYVNAFHQGAIGPDLGYFPGGHKLLSELSHMVRSGDLTRSLARRAVVIRPGQWHAVSSPALVSLHSSDRSVPSLLATSSQVRLAAAAAARAVFRSSVRTSISTAAATAWTMTATAPLKPAAPAAHWSRIS